ncbi:hypothetical protein [Hymenobacter jeollabukensis]|uniref:NERD domain-containing protein n=1 Tax=Hymenobacter jeollabukensis TaxID=2025313 RepID=A0A5R8WNT7_9BACT|nr:hypothetical protein [Hymenobacter jeollabukensis]TLM91699.1 hypothetical protein FDY95_14140 [Hymenobacter jeollabukensis]
MLHSFLFAPFDDAAAEAQFDALHATLQPLAAGDEPLLLLGNLPLDDAGALDAVLLRPAGIVLLQFIGRGGPLHIPALNQGAWQLAGQPLTGQAGSANPYAQFQRQRRALAAWLTAQPALGPIRTEAIAGLALFSQPVTFGSEVEPRLNAQSGADNFQLLSSLPHLPRRLQRLHLPGAALPAAALQQWLRHLQAESAGTDSAADDAEDQPTDFWTQKARQLWRWLGAEDIPPDTGYAGYQPDPAAVSAAEKARLEQVRQQVRAELDQHTQALTAREVEREATIRQLQQQLDQAAAAAPTTAELQARLAAETREKEALHEAMQLARVESAARNRELDARIAQLGVLIQQMQVRPVAPAPPAPVTPPHPAPTPPAAAPAPRPVARPRVRRYSTWQLQPWRAVAVLVVVLGLLVGGWGLLQLYRERAQPAPDRREARQVSPTETTDEPADQAAEPTEAAPSALEERLNNAVIDSTGTQTGPAPTDSVLAPSPGYIDPDSLENQN